MQIRTISYEAEEYTKTILQTELYSLKWASEDMETFNHDFEDSLSYIVKPCLKRGSEEKWLK
jgi:hypothetical protein